MGKSWRELYPPDTSPETAAILGSATDRHDELEFEVRQAISMLGHTLTWIEEGEPVSCPVDLLEVVTVVVKAHSRLTALGVIDEIVEVAAKMRN